MKQDDNQLVSGFQPDSNCGNNSIDTSCEVFSFILNPHPPPVNLKEPPPNSQICIIQTNSRHNVQINSETNIVSISKTIDIIPENYFYITIQPNCSEMRICSAVNNFYLSIDKDNILVLKEDIESSSTFELFTKVYTTNYSLIFIQFHSSSLIF